MLKVLTIHIREVWESHMRYHVKMFENDISEPPVEQFDEVMGFSEGCLTLWSPNIHKGASNQMHITSAIRGHATSLEHLRDQIVGIMRLSVTRLRISAIGCHADEPISFDTMQIEGEELLDVFIKRIVTVAAYIGREPDAFELLKELNNEED